MSPPSDISSVSSSSDPLYWRAAEDDHWLRHILENGAVRTKVPRLKVKYVADRLEHVNGRPWEAEISGRLLSAALDIQGRASAEAALINQPGIIKFRQVAFIGVQVVRRDTNMDVYAEPTERDPAHANLVIYKLPMANALQGGTAPKISHELVKSLCDLFQVCDAADLSPIEMLRH